MSLPRPPKNTPLLDQFNAVTREWVLFFDKLALGDPGDLWVPTYTSLTVVGSVTHSGIFYRISNNLMYFAATITPTGGGTSASTAGTTYINNWPNTIIRDSVISAGNSDANTGLGNGIALSSNNRIYTPAWSAVNQVITVCGIIQGR